MKKNKRHPIMSWLFPTLNELNQMNQNHDMTILPGWFIVITLVGLGIGLYITSVLGK